MEEKDVLILKSVLIAFVLLSIFQFFQIYSLKKKIREPVLDKSFFYLQDYYRGMNYLEKLRSVYGCQGYKEGEKPPLAEQIYDLISCLREKVATSIEAIK